MDSTYYPTTTAWVIAVNILFLIDTRWLLKKGNSTALFQTLFILLSLAWIAFIHYVFSNKRLLSKVCSGRIFYGRSAWV